MLEKEEKTRWTGVKNALALKHLRSVKRGDEILIYHTGKEKQIVGIARAIANAENDSVLIEAVRSLARPVTLAEVKANAELRDFALVRMSRLSVMPVTDWQWSKLVFYK